MKKVLFVLLALAALTLAACGGGAPAAEATLAPVPADYAGKTGAGDAAAGAEVFKTQCAPCHGDSGHGDGPSAAALSPTPKNLATLQATAGDDYLYWRIATGKEGTSMVAWLKPAGLLEDQQIWDVVAFINTLK